MSFICGLVLVLSIWNVRRKSSRSAATRLLPTAQASNDISTGDRTIVERVISSLSGTSRYSAGFASALTSDKTSKDISSSLGAFTESGVPYTSKSNPRHKTETSNSGVGLPIHGSNEVQVATKRRDEEIRRLRLWLKYRSHQFGFIELDTLVGGFAEYYVTSMSVEELKEFEFILVNVSNHDLFSWISGKVQAPEHFQKLKVLQRLLTHICTSHPNLPGGYTTNYIETNDMEHIPTPDC
eukprot:GHVT01077335.1.p1 GENE.GHVT01077335.1~~GHVT01077335.1.p1  ORF type:complete len:239 (-),score=6.07 GHVT01077335.1:445-1161(-)